MGDFLASVSEAAEPLGEDVAMDRLRALSTSLEERAETYLTKKARKNFLSSAGPGFLVLTFVEDGLRIFLRWEEQHVHVHEEL